MAKKLTYLIIYFLLIYFIFFCDFRRCKKSNEESQTKSVLVKTKRGCSQLTYLLANNLKKISWPAVEPKKYMGLMASFITLNTVMCPKDSGFLMVLKYLPRLRMLLNEKGGKIIETLMADRKRLKVIIKFRFFWEGH